MSTIKDDDKFLVQRGQNTYRTDASELMSTIQDTDLMLVQRGSSSYKVTCGDVKDQLGGGDSPGNIGVPVVVLTPADGAGINDGNAPDAAELVFTSANGTPPTTEFTGEGLTLARRVWIISQSNDGTSNSWGEPVEYEDDSVENTQDGATEWTAPDNAIRPDKYYKVSVRYETEFQTVTSETIEFKTKEPLYVTSSLRFNKQRQTQLRRPMGDFSPSVYPIVCSYWIKTEAKDPPESWYIWNVRPRNDLLQDFGYGQVHDTPVTGRSSVHGFIYYRYQTPFFEQPAKNVYLYGQGQDGEWHHYYYMMWPSDYGQQWPNWYVNYWYDGVNQGVSSTSGDWNMDGALKPNMGGSSDLLMGRGYDGNYADGLISQFCFMTQCGNSGDTSSWQGVMDPEKFGFFDDDGKWTPRMPEESKNNMNPGIGSQSFFLSFDPTQPNGIGHDSSGKGNHFTDAQNFIPEDSQQSAPRSGMGLLYDERNETTIMRHEMQAKYGTNTAIPELGIYELTEQPKDGFVAAYVRVEPDETRQETQVKYRPIHDYSNELKETENELAIANQQVEVYEDVARELKALRAEIKKDK